MTWTGKTYTAGALREVYEKAGYQSSIKRVSSEVIL